MSDWMPAEERKKNFKIAVVSYEVLRGSERCKMAKTAWLVFLLSSCRGVEANFRRSGCDRKRTDGPFSTERTVRSLSITTTQIWDQWLKIIGLKAPPRLHLIASAFEVTFAAKSAFSEQENHDIFREDDLKDSFLNSTRARIPTRWEKQ